MPVSQADSYNGIALHFNVDKDIRRITNVDNIITVCVQKGDWSFIKGGLSTKTERMLFYCNWYCNKTEHYPLRSDIRNTERNETDQCCVIGI